MKIITFKKLKLKFPFYIEHTWYPFIDGKIYRKDTFVYHNGYGSGAEFIGINYVVVLHNIDIYKSDTLSEAKNVLVDEIAIKQRWK